MQHLIDQIGHFFEHYKDLEPGKWVKVTGWGDEKQAAKMIEEAMARAERQAAEAVREADERAKAELQKARDTIAAEKRQAVQEIRAIAVDLTIQATGKLLQQEVDAEKNKPLVAQFVQGAENA